ncbi:hypothetical protein B0H19DRAFT_1141306 [Mycena capillaripes]|nr:hypothetical protein B0H19DRAFT_1141306 [Mycena capillaripes]
MAAASQAELQAELFQLIADARTTNYLAVAAMTLAVVDLIGNLKDEVQLIWKGPLRISNRIYLWIRYFSLVTVAIYTSCAYAAGSQVRSYVGTQPLICICSTH